MMKEAPEIFYYLVLPTLGFIIWLIRLDLKAAHNNDQIKEVLVQLKDHSERDDRIHVQVTSDLTEIRENVSEIRGALRGR